MLRTMFLFTKPARSIRGNTNTHLTSLQCACRLKSFFEKFLFSCLCSQLRAVSFHAISCLACQTVLRPRSRLVDFNKFYYNLKADTRRARVSTRKHGHEGAGHGHKGTGFRYARVLISSNCSRIRFLLKRHNLLFEGF